MNKQPSICIIGSRGVVSTELQSRLSSHGSTSSDVVPTADALACDTLDRLEEIRRADLVVLAALDFASNELMSRMPAGKRVLDVSPAFRTAKGWAYGLPELPGYGVRIATAERVANPGCFATAAILPIEPLVRAGAIRQDMPLVLDAVGGYTTGGTRMIEKAEAGALAAESVHSLLSMHRHVWEIEAHTGIAAPVWFTPKIAAYPRGIRVHVPIFGCTSEYALELYHAAYDGSVIVVEDTMPPKISGDEWAGRPGACIRVQEMRGGCAAICTMDNLGKGAVDSALQNIGLMLGISFSRDAAASSVPAA